MRNTVKRLVALLLALAMVFGCAALAGCKKTYSNDKVAIYFDNEEITLSEYKLYLFTIQYDTEKNNSGLIDTLYGDAMNFWMLASDGTSNMKSIRQEAVRKIVQTRVLVKQAKEDGVTLTDAEKTAVEQVIKDFKEEMSAVIERSGADEDTVRRLVEENALANKEYLHLVSGIDTTFTEEEKTSMQRARIDAIAVLGKLSIPEKDRPETEAPSSTEEGETASNPTFTSEEQHDNVLNALSNIMVEIEGGKSLDEVIRDWEGNDYVTVYELGESAVSAEQAGELTGSDYTSYEQMGWYMEEGDLKNWVTKNSAGNWVAYIVNKLKDDDPDYRAEEEKKVIKKRQAEAFTPIYENLFAAYEKPHLAEEVILSATIEQTIYYSDPTSQTDSTSNYLTVETETEPNYATVEPEE